MPLLSRLHELHSNRQFRIGLVCYSIHPTPLLSKSFFGLPQAIVKDLKEDPARFGIGQTGSGGSRGMAALEGLVAAIELFDVLKENMENAVCHIIHIASSTPDSADRPLKNSSPKLDTVSWDSLPTELRKRDINYSNVLLQKIPKLAQFHALAATGQTQSPWFNVRTPHSINLSGYPLHKTGVKRANEPTSADRSPEAKRARTGTVSVSAAVSSPRNHHASPKNVSQSSPKNLPTAAHPVTPVIAPTAPQAPSLASTSVNVNTGNASAATNTQPPIQGVPTHPPGFPPGTAVPPALLQQILDRLKAGEKEIQAKVARRNELEANGQTVAAEQLKKEIGESFARYQKLKLILSNQVNIAKQVHAQAQGTGSQATTSTQAQNAIQQPPLPQSQPQQPPQQQATIQQSPQLQQQQPPHPQPQPPQLPPHHAQQQQQQQQQPQMPSHQIQLPPNASPQVAAQMQKLLEQQRKTPRMGNAQIPAPVQQPKQQQPEQIQSAPQPQSIAKIWRGIISYKGLDSGTHVRKDLQAHVAIGFHAKSHTPEVRLDTWPSTLQLSPSKEPALPMSALRTWLTSVGAVPFFMAPEKPARANLSPQDLKTLDENYATLVKLLTDRKLYALAAWPGLDGQNHNRILIFPIPDGRLGGAYFAGGIPELPKQPDKQPLPPQQQPNLAATTVLGLDLSKIPPHLAALVIGLGPENHRMLNTLPPDKRMAALQALMKQKLAQSQRLGNPPQGQPSSPSQQQLPGPPFQQQPQMGMQQHMTATDASHMGANMQQQQMHQQSQSQVQTFNPFSLQAGTPMQQHVQIPQQQQQQQQQQQHQQQQPPPGFPGMPVGMPGMNPGMGVPPSMQPHPLMSFGMGMPQPGMMPPGMAAAAAHHQRNGSGQLPPGGIGGRVSQEMMQSFMQRSRDGSHPGP
ncbi:hypothetical protein C8Q75DRAFT_811741 [Abortiporus biennis]|nr:hypothetical protein C8Q75DRAFT_811741 [Abortiporus biennis]